MKCLLKLIFYSIMDGKQFSNNNLISFGKWNRKAVIGDEVLLKPAHLFLIPDKNLYLFVLIRSLGSRQSTEVTSIIRKTLSKTFNFVDNLLLVSGYVLDVPYHYFRKFLTEEEKIKRYCWSVLCICSWFPLSSLIVFSRECYRNTIHDSTYSYLHT